MAYDFTMMQFMATVRFLVSVCVKLATQVLSVTLMMMCVDTRLPASIMGHAQTLALILTHVTAPLSSMDPTVKKMWMSVTPPILASMEPPAW